jgi:DNA-binding LytR/AlgR family response regulator
MLHSFFIRIDGKYQGIAFDDIHYVEACKNYVRIVTATQSFLPHVTMKQVEEQLPLNLFCRIHRSYIVSLNKITAFDHEFIYLKKVQLHLGPQYFELLKSKLLIICSEVKNKRGNKILSINECYVKNAISK